MILQELIRNFILYREVVKPLFTSWKESFAAGYYREIAGMSSSELNVAIQRIKTLQDGEEFGWDISDEYEAKSVSQISGTRTITNKFFISQNNPEADVPWETALVSKKISIMLRDTKIDENVVDIIKTDPLIHITSREAIVLRTREETTTTTGFKSKQIKSFLIVETHEKREYLGEFSLTHEEIPLFAFSERRWVS